MKININFGEILTKAAQITWKFKVLWIFGILAGCSASGRGNVNFNTGNRWNMGNGNPGMNQVPEWLRRFLLMRPEQALGLVWEQYAGIIIAVVLALCCLGLLRYILGIIGKTGLIKGIGSVDAGAERTSFGEIWTGSMPYFWRMFWLSVLVGLPFFLITVILVVAFGASAFSVIQAHMSGGGLAAFLLGIGGLFLAALCVVALAAVIVGLIMEQAQNAIVLEDLGVLAGLGRGWNIFRSNLLSVIVMGLILWVIGIVLGLVIGIPMLIVIIPAVIAIGASVVAKQWMLFTLMTCGLLAVVIPVSLLLNGILLTYFQSAWTLTFRRLTAPAPAAPEISAPTGDLLPQ